MRQVRETPRERVMTDAEIVTLWQAQPGRMNPGTLRALRLLLLTGARSGEVVGIARSELDLDARRWLLPAERSKNRMAHVVPLTDPALEIITAALAESWSDQWLFPAARGTGHMTGYGLQQAMERLFGPDHPTVHDIRRTVGTRLSELGFNRLIIDKVLNHKDNVRRRHLRPAHIRPREAPGAGSMGARTGPAGDWQGRAQQRAAAAHPARPITSAFHCRLVPSCRMACYIARHDPQLQAQRLGRTVRARRRQRHARGPGGALPGASWRPAARAEPRRP